MGEKLPILSKPPLGAYETSPRVWIKAMGPTGRSADQSGRPAYQWRQPPPTSSGGLSCAALSGPRWCWLVLSGFGLVLRLHLVQMGLNQCSDIFCDFMSGQSVLATCILAQKYNLHFLEAEVWFRDFIGQRCV